jgi:16S rRNA (uracil1498-N3)-methyltransferase
MQRFFVQFPLSIDLHIDEKEMIHQISHVLRMQVGEDIILFDGDGSETRYRIEEITKKYISLRGQERLFPKTEKWKRLVLYQALPNKYEKIEYIIEKGVEVGIQKFVFFRSERSQKLVINENKIIRFRAIAREALEQCGGLVFPEIYFLDSYSNDHIEGISVVLHTENTVGISPKDSSAITLFVGPEGGWSPKEIEQMNNNGFIFAHIGNRVLRTETAGVVVSFALLEADTIKDIGL